MSGARRRSYIVGDDEDWFGLPQRPGRTKKIACCDCGLVHRWRARIVRTLNGGRRVMVNAERDNRATAAVRRERNKRWSDDHVEKQKLVDLAVEELQRLIGDEPAPRDGRGTARKEQTMTKRILKRRKQDQPEATRDDESRSVEDVLDDDARERIDEAHEDAQDEGDDE